MEHHSVSITVTTLESSCGIFAECADQDQTAENMQSHVMVETTLTHYQTTNFRLFQTERVCRRRFQI